MKGSQHSVPRFVGGLLDHGLERLNCWAGSLPGSPLALELLHDFVVLDELPLLGIAPFSLPAFVNIRPVIWRPWVGVPYAGQILGLVVR